nr:MAG TPA: hypothetical protein [Caudoviricetes sp.]
MDDNINVYITSDYSVVLDKIDITIIADDVRMALYDMPRPDDYTVADVLTQAIMSTRMYIEDKIECEAQEEYCFGDLDHKKRTKSDYWHVIKLVLEQIEVIAK